jgi:hypothetical protein
VKLTKVGTLDAQMGDGSAEVGSGKAAMEVHELHLGGVQVQSDTAEPAGDVLVESGHKFSKVAMV